MSAVWFIKAHVLRGYVFFVVVFKVIRSRCILYRLFTLSEYSVVFFGLH